MYYPYFRGRQNELLCIRELLEMGKLSSKVIPIIEPVHFNATFFLTLSKFIELERKIIVIRNPKVGDYLKDKKEMLKKIQREEDEKKRIKLQNTFDSYLEVMNNEYIGEAYLCDDDVVKMVLNGDIDIRENILINSHKRTCMYYVEHGEKLVANLTLIPDVVQFKREVVGPKVVLEDGYVKAKRNVDYINAPDEFFSLNHIGYADGGYSGFSDYSIVGEEYEESGFAPLAIAIHVMYYGGRKELRVHHFVSDSNEDTSDLARKFEEAMYNMITWEKFEEIPKTEGIIRLIECYNNGKFPGLGVIKRYSLMHHMQMMSEYLGEK